MRVNAFVPPHPTLSRGGERDFKRPLAARASSPPPAQEHPQPAEGQEPQRRGLGRRLGRGARRTAERALDRHEVHEVDVPNEVGVADAKLP